MDVSIKTEKVTTMKFDGHSVKLTHPENSRIDNVKYNQWAKILNYNVIQTGPYSPTSTGSTR